MRANNTQLNLSDDRRKEYQRQQERLKAMGSAADKVKSVSADAMIENLLKDSFKKPPQTQTPVEKQDNLNLELPSWLQCESPMVPPQYKHLWPLVQSSFELADTQKVSHLLLTSGLHVDVLGFIWSLVNKTIPGQLTKQEFFIMLALVGLAQTGCTFSNLNVLKILPSPSVPVLQAPVLKSPQDRGPANATDSDLFQDFQSFPLQPCASLNENNIKRDQLFTNNAENDISFTPKGFDNKKEKIETDLIHGNVCSKPNRINEPYILEINKGPYKNSNFPCIGSSPTAEIEDDFTEFQSVPADKTEVLTTDKSNNVSPDAADDFSDFQSANVEHIDPFETVVITQKRDIPKITLPKSLSGKLTSLKSNILKISPESERKLKVLAQPESLSSLPESKISSNNKVSTSISVLGSNHGIGSRLANHSLSAKLDRTKHHKHHKIKINPTFAVQSTAEEEIILGVRRTNIENLIPKCCPKKPVNCKTFILKETKIRHDNAPEPDVTEHFGSESVVHTGENTRQIEIPMLGTFNETVLPTQTKSLTGVDLISVQEDKYSALREIELELNQDKPLKSSDLEEGNDEFGDFLSADLPNIANVPDSVSIPEPISSLLSENVEEKEAWGDWSFNTEPNPVELNNEKKSEEPFMNTKHNLLDSFNLVTLSDDKAKPSEPQPSTPQIDIFNQIESSVILDSISPSKNDNLDPLIVCENVPEKTNLQTQSKPDQLSLSQSDNEFWDFLASDAKPSTGNTLSRHGSLPSLDFKMTMEETEQEVVWRKCIDSCHNLIQEGFEIFSNINMKSVLDEVFASPKTSEYLNYLCIVFNIAKRIFQNYNDFSIQEEVERLWGRLEELSFEYNIKLKQNEDNVSEGKLQCSICLGYICLDSIKQGQSNYHPSCANLWINFVEISLPYST